MKEELRHSRHDPALLLPVTPLFGASAASKARRWRNLSIVVVLMMSGGVARAECVATPCYIERIGVVSCRPVSELSANPEILERSGLEPEQVKTLLEEGSGVVIRGKIDRSRPVSQCGEPDPKRLADGSEIKEYLAMDATCESFPLGYPTEGFVSTPCCDTLPLDSAECVLSLETLGPTPAWVKPEQPSPKGSTF